jgi:hypothetical protein
MQFDKEELEILTGQHEQPCVSFFLPTRRATKEVHQGSVHLKNLVRHAEEQAHEWFERPLDARNIFEPVKALIEDHTFWQHQRDGLALFLSPDFFRYYRTPRSFQEQVIVAGRFHLKPLLPLLIDYPSFYVLALNQNQVRLFEGGLDNISEVEVETMPPSLQAVVAPRERERQLQFHTRASGAGTERRAAVFHGHGDSERNEKEEIVQFFREVDRGLRDFLNDARVPLILAGVEYYFPIYRNITKYPQLADDGITGSAEQFDLSRFQEEAWRIAEPAIMASRQATIERFYNQRGTGRVSSELADILNAAHQGRVDTLFVQRGAQIWGSYDPTARSMRQDHEPTAKNEDLLDLAALQTIRNSGTAYLLEKAKMPEEKTIAAIYRY